MYKVVIFLFLFTGALAYFDHFLTATILFKSFCLTVFSKCTHKHIGTFFPSGNYQVILPNSVLAVSPFYCFENCCCCLNIYYNSCTVDLVCVCALSVCGKFFVFACFKMLYFFPATVKVCLVIKIYTGNFY